MASTTTLSFISPFLSHRISRSTQNLLYLRTNLSYSSAVSLASSSACPGHGRTLPCSFTNTTHYEFNDDSQEVELRLELGNESTSQGEVYVDASENCLVIRLWRSGYTKTLLDTSSLYGMIKPSETIWYIDDTELVVSLKKQDPELKWHDIMETWESLTTGVAQLLKGTSIFLVGESTEINNRIARELAVGLGYTPLSTEELLEAYTNQTIDSWKTEDGSDALTEAEAAILESLNEESAKEEARKNIEDGEEVVVKLGGWDATHTKTVARASLSAFKRLILSDKNLTARKSLYVRLGCRGDWPNIKAPGWDPSAAS